VSVNCETHLDGIQAYRVPAQTERIIRIPGMTTPNVEKHRFAAPVAALFVAVWRSHCLHSITVAYQPTKLIGRFPIQRTLRTVLSVLAHESGFCATWAQPFVGDSPNSLGNLPVRFVE
jgi:hypothetical protein